MMTAQTKNALRVHIGLLIAEAICISAFVLELHRALSGNTLSWAYVFEWPILGVYGIFMWRRLLRNDALTATPPTPDENVDAVLDRYNEYLHQIHGDESQAGHTTSRPSGPVEPRP